MGIGNTFKKAREEEEKSEIAKQNSSNSGEQKNDAEEASQNAEQPQESNSTTAVHTSENKRPTKKTSKKNLPKSQVGEGRIVFADALVKNTTPDKSIDRLYVRKEQKEKVEKIVGILDISQIDFVSNMIDLFFENTKTERAELLKKEMKKFSEF